MRGHRYPADVLRRRRQPLLVGECAPLAPMVESGQVQLGNHTWSHPDITRIGLDAVADQIRRNGDFLRTTYGVDGTPYFRPPYCLAQLRNIINSHGLHTVTLADVFS
ncbi:MAG TPA: polysaccharide deacetylase family protein [Mycobacterium sp.]|nr:polysaccharide deacetylase family protein [Mycobacterium sp.]HTX96514.1 polysaccharide deacetylase family protein [Mycobacterium sp.]